MPKPKETPVVEARQTQVYISGKYEARARLRVIRHKIQRLGYACRCDWLDETAERHAVTREYQQEVARRDIQQIHDASIFILDTLDESTTGGREVEYGAAGARTLNPPRLWVVGPTRNVFHTLADQQFQTWETALTVLRAMTKTKGGKQCLS